MVVFLWDLLCDLLWDLLRALLWDVLKEVVVVQKHGARTASLKMLLLSSVLCDRRIDDVVFVLCFLLHCWHS
jgi:hypothetical protein